MKLFTWLRKKLKHDHLWKIAWRGRVEYWMCVCRCGKERLPPRQTENIERWVGLAFAEANGVTYTNEELGFE